jgi:hypothetical protein
MYVDGPIHITNCVPLRGSFIYLGHKLIFVVRTQAACARTHRNTYPAVHTVFILLSDTWGAHVRTYIRDTYGPQVRRYAIVDGAGVKPVISHSTLTAKFSLRSWNSPVPVLMSSSNLLSRASKWPGPCPPVRETLSTSSNFSLTTCCWTPPWRPKPAGLAIDLTSSEQQ